MFNDSCRREYSAIKDLSSLLIPREGIAMFSYNNKRVSIESDNKFIRVYVLSRGMLASAMPDYEIKYSSSATSKEIISDLKEYFLNEKIIKK